MFLVNSKIKFSKFLLGATLVVLFFSCITEKIFAASLSFSSKNSNVSIGGIVSIQVWVGTDKKYINNIDGIIQYPSDLLDVLSISKSSSIFTMWVEEPKFSNIDGKISFNGGLPNPGYLGENGEIISVVFKTKKQGTASIFFSEAAVRENDGLGTDILKNKSNFIVNIISDNFVPKIVPSLSLKTPETPIVSSSLTPNSDNWYSTKKTTFSWTLPKDIIAIETLLGKYPDSEPYVLYNPAISSKTVEDLGEGVLYFHIRYQNENGWSKVAHKKIKIDNTSPENIISSYKTLDSGLIELSLNSKDKISSISKFVLLIDEEKDIEINNITEGENAKFVFTEDYTGTKEIKIKAYDQAGNIKESGVSIIFPKISYPEFVSYPKGVFIGEDISLSAVSSYPNTEVEIYAQFNNGEIKSYKVRTKDDGSFYYTIENINEDGPLSVWSKVLIPGSFKWITSEKITILINETSYTIWINKLIKILPIVIVLLIVLLIIRFIIPKISCLYKNKDKNNKNNKIKKIEKGILFLVDSLRENILEDIHSFNKSTDVKDIDEIEEIVLENLLKDLNNMEGVISSRLKRNKNYKKK